MTNATRETRSNTGQAINGQQLKPSEEIEGWRQKDLTSTLREELSSHIKTQLHWTDITNEDLKSLKSLDSFISKIKNRTAVISIAEFVMEKFHDRHSQSGEMFVGYFDLLRANSVFKAAIGGVGFDERFSAEKIKVDSFKETFRRACEAKPHILSKWKTPEAKIFLEGLSRPTHIILVRVIAGRVKEFKHVATILNNIIIKRLKHHKPRPGISNEEQTKRCAISGDLKYAGFLLKQEPSQIYLKIHLQDMEETGTCIDRETGVLRDSNGYQDSEPEKEYTQCEYRPAKESTRPRRKLQVSQAISHKQKLLVDVTMPQKRRCMDFSNPMNQEANGNDGDLRDEDSIPLTPSLTQAAPRCKAIPSQVDQDTSPGRHGSDVAYSNDEHSRNNTRKSTSVEGRRALKLTSGLTTRYRNEHLHNDINSGMNGSNVNKGEEETMRSNGQSHLLSEPHRDSVKRANNDDELQQMDTSQQNGSASHVTNTRSPSYFGEKDGNDGNDNEDRPDEYNWNEGSKARDGYDLSPSPVSYRHSPSIHQSIRTLKRLNGTPSSFSEMPSKCICTNTERTKFWRHLPNDDETIVRVLTDVVANNEAVCSEHQAIFASKLGLNDPKMQGDELGRISEEKEIENKILVIQLLLQEGRTLEEMRTCGRMATWFNTPTGNLRKFYKHSPAFPSTRAPDYSPLREEDFQRHRLSFGQRDLPATMDLNLNSSTYKGNAGQSSILELMQEELRMYEFHGRSHLVVNTLAQRFLSQHPRVYYYALMAGKSCNYKLISLPCPVDGQSLHCMDLRVKVNIRQMLLSNAQQIVHTSISVGRDETFLELAPDFKLARWHAWHNVERDHIEDMLKQAEVDTDGGGLFFSKEDLAKLQQPERYVVEKRHSGWATFYDACCPSRFNTAEVHQSIDPCFIPIQDDHMTLGLDTGNNWRALANAHKYGHLPMFGIGGEQNPESMPLFPNIDLPSLGILPDCIIGKSRWDIPAVNMEVERFLGTKDGTQDVMLGVSKYIQEWESKNILLLRQTYQALREEEKKMFGTRSFYSRIDEGESTINEAAADVEYEEEDLIEAPVIGVRSERRVGHYWTIETDGSEIELKRSKVTEFWDNSLL